MRGTLVTAVIALAQRQHGALTTHQLRRLGVSAKAERAARRDGWLVVAEPGVLVLASSPATWMRRLRVGLLALDGRGWVSHEAAAAMYAFDRTPAEPVEFTVPRAARGLRCASLVHTTDDIAPADVRTVRGLRCASPTRTIIDLAHAGASPARLAAALASAQRLGLTSHRQVAARLAARRRPGCWGAADLDRVLSRPALGVVA
jgi:hypothetical protein